jgi:hypothetical protein
METDNWEKVETAIEFGQPTLKSRKAGLNIQNNLTNMLHFQQEMLPTPRTCSAMGATITPESAHDSKRFPNLETIVGKALLPTPSTMDIREDIRSPEERSMEANKGGCSNLREKIAMLPTPQSRDWKDSTSNVVPPSSGVTRGYRLADMLTPEKILPTPRAGNPGSRPNKKGGKVLAEQITMLGTPRAQERPRSEKFLEKEKGIQRAPTPSEIMDQINKSQTGMNTGTRLPQGSALKLQPEFCLWMMGFPEDWLDLPATNAQPISA